MTAVISAHRSLNLILDYVESMSRIILILSLPLPERQLILPGYWPDWSIKLVIGASPPASDGMDALLTFGITSTDAGFRLPPVAINGAEKFVILGGRDAMLSNPDLKEA